VSLSATLYDVYSLLYDRFSTGLFNFTQLMETARLNLQSGLKYASLLRSRGHMIVFSRSGRARMYRLLSPEQALFAHLHLKNLRSIRQERYLHLLVDACAQLHRSDLGLMGVWLFGSVARGEARPNSDVDLIVVAKNLKEEKGKMAGAVYARLEIGEERKFLLRNGFATDVSVYPMTERELFRFYPIMLDVIDHGIVVYEKGEVLTRVARSMQDGMARLGVRKVQLRRGWMWLLPPQLRVGERVGVQEPLESVSRPG